VSRGRTAYFTGLAAEDMVARAYRARGGQVLARRWRVPGAEIDLIVRLDGVIVFVEVKARKTMAAARSAMRPAQQARLLACAEQYLARHASLNAPCRFDFVAVSSTGEICITENTIE
jgi:putative endonuclease